MKLEGIPAEMADAELAGEAVHITLDDAVGPLEALYGASYFFVDRCWVWVDRTVSGRYRVVLAPRSGNADADTLEAVAGEFARELLSCVWRHQIVRDNRATMEAVTMEALAGDGGLPSEGTPDDADEDAGAEPGEPFGPG